MDGHDDSHGRLRSVLTSIRKGKDDTPASPSPDSASQNGEVLEKVKSKVPGHNKRKEKRRKAQVPVDAEETSRGRDTSGTKVPVSASLPATDSRSTLDSQKDAEGGSGSLMTSEDEDEHDGLLSKSTPAMPPLASHESYRGYLTSSSPNVLATSLAETPLPSPVGIVQGSNPARSSTTPMASRSAIARSNSRSRTSRFNGDSTLSLGSSGSGSPEKARSVSPGARLKEALLSGSKKPNGTPSPPRSSPLMSPPDTSRSFTERRASRGADPIPPIPTNQTWHASGHQSNKSLPSIITTPGTPPPLPNKSVDKLPTVVAPPSPDDDFTISSPTKPDESTALSDPPVQSFEAAPAVLSPHRRARSDSQTHAPSKLSQSMTAPLTPTVEEGRTPGTRNISVSSSSGFFTSMFSAAQNAATTLTSLGNNNRSRSSTSATQPEDRSRDVSPADAEAKKEPPVPEEPEVEPTKALAIDTIGSGDLSLSHLGITLDDQASAGSASQQQESGQSRSRSGTVVHREDKAAREEESSAARAVSAAYEEPPTEAITPFVEDIAPLKTNGPAMEVGNGEDRTPNGSVVDGEPGGLLRSASLKSKLGRTRTRARDGSQSTLGASMSINGSTMMNSTASVPKVTGYAVASKKRNKDFHTLFKSVPENDYLIEDYSCALQRDIILAGRIYVSEGHICFSSNILGWVTTLVISFDEVVSVEKESTAMVFPNAIAIQTLHARHTFRSLLSREATYDLLIGIWKISHPGLQSSENGTRVVNSTGSKTEKIRRGDGSDGSEEEDLDDDEDGTESDNDQGSGIVSGEGSVAAGEDAGSSPPKSAIPKKPSNIGVAAGQAAASGPAGSDVKAAAQANGAAIASADFPGPAAHAPTQCADSATHYPTVLKDDVIAAPLGKIYNMVFGPASGGFMSRWLVDDQKSQELCFEDDKKGLGEEVKTRSYNYIKPLGGSIGPKQTKCITTEVLDAFDLEKAVSVTVTTQTPDVPSGNVFSVKTRYCLMWAPNSGTRFIASCTIEWTGKSWLKSPIEKGANDGQVVYVNDLLKALRASIAKGKTSANGSPPSGSKSKRSKKKRGADAEETASTTSAPTKPKASDWGLFEPLHSILSPILDILSPVLNVYALVVLLSVLLMISWFRSPAASSSAARSLYRAPTSQRIAAYEELWRAEEAALWKWLEERVGGAEGINVPLGKTNEDKGNADRRKVAKGERQKVLRGEEVGGIAEKEVERAVEITEQKLQTLKDAMRKVKDSGRAESGEGVL